VVVGISRPPRAAALFGAACADQVTGDSLAVELTAKGIKYDKDADLD